MSRILVVMCIISFCIFTINIPVDSTIPSENNSSTKDLIIQVSTDKSQYQVGEAVEIIITVTNTGSEDITLVFSTSQKADFMVDGYLWSNGMVFLQVITYLTIESGETKILLQDYWNQVDDSNNQVPEGEYTIDGWMIPDYHANPIKITVGGPDSLVGYWNFDEGSGNIAHDSSGNNNHGTIHEANWTSGISGNALSFDGVNDYVDCGYNDSYQITNEITLSAWIKSSNIFKNYMTIIIQGDTNGGHPNTYPYILITDQTTGHIKFIVRTAEWDEYPQELGPRVISPNALENNTWYHLTGVYNGSKSSLYINGIEVASEPWAGNIQTIVSNLTIGNCVIREGYEFDGIIDEVRIYNRALNKSEVMQLYSFALGDMNGDGRLNAADVRYLAMYLNGDPSYSPLYADGDVNSDGRINAADVRYLAMYLNGDPVYSPLYP